MPLTQKQRKQIEAYTRKFKDWLTTEEGREDKLERDERKKKFQNLFSRKNLESLDSPEQFVQMVRDNFWCARNLLRFNEKEIINHGIEKIKGELAELLYGDSPLFQRLEKFIDSKNGLGQAFATELLNYYYPNEAVLVNERLRDVEEEILGRPNRDYVTHKEFVDDIRSLLRERRVEIRDYAEVDSFVNFVHLSLDSEPSSKTEFSGFEEKDFDKLGSLEGNKEISEKLSALASALIEKFPERMQQIVNFQVSRVTKPYTSTPRNHMWVMFGKEPRGIQNLVHPEVLIWRKANEVDVRLNACSTEHAAVSSGERKLFSKKIKQHLTDFKRLLKNLGPEYSLEYKLNYGEEGEQRASELDEKVIDDLAEKGIKDFLIVRKFGPEEIFQDDFVDKIREIMVEKYWPLYTFSLKEGPLDIDELTYFILQTGGGEYEDEPERKYHFKQGIPGSVQLRNAENKGKFVYYENGKFYGKGEIGKITSYEQDGVTYYYAGIKNFQRIKPIDINDVSNDLSFDSVGQAGIRKMSREDYDTIVTFAPPGRTNLDFLRKRLDVVLEDLSFNPLLFEDEENLKLQIYSALVSGKNIMLVGPPGTGKTEIALSLCRMASKKEYIHGYVLTTATSDWTTFDTIGGYVPSKEGKSLEFMPGQFLRCFKENDKPVNKWLVIDEINRSDIDKAFGQLFTVLSGQRVELPFLQESRSLEIIPSNNFKKLEISQSEYVVPNSWRLIATMNTYDKASLYQMSYAFMRRFAFIYIDVPSSKFIEDNWSRYLEYWGIDVPEKLESCANDVKEFWKSMNKDSKRPLGPAIIKDMLEFVVTCGSSIENLDKHRTQILTNAVSSFVLPQFEGLEKDDLDELKKRLNQYCIPQKIETLFEEMFEG